MAIYGNFFAGYPVLGWSYDNLDEINSRLEESFLKNQIEEYKQIYDEQINPLITQTSFSIDFGGESEKDKLIAVDRPLGVFNFSLASKTLYRKQEYYSPELASEYPKMFEHTEKPAGIVPPSLVNTVNVAGELKFYYRDEKLQRDFNCIKQQEGTQAISDGVFGASLKFGSRTRKVYNTYRKKGGKVKYVEIYSPFYFDRSVLNTELQYAVRHLPVMMVAKYLENAGIMTKVFLTRFVLLDQNRPYPIIRKAFSDGTRNPLYELQENKKRGKSVESLFIQPIPVKQYGEELNLSKMMMYSRYDSSLYLRIAREALYNECSNNPDVFGNPTFTQDKYLEGFERFRQKYIEYTRMGIWKAKEVIAEGMIFFHDISIQKYFRNFMEDTRLRSISRNEIDILKDPEVNAFFNWWMVASANTIKNKIDLLNSDDRIGTINKIQVQLRDHLLELESIVENTTAPSMEYLFREYGDKVKNVLSLGDIYSYIDLLTDEVTSYSQNNFFPTPEDSIESRDEFKTSVMRDLANI